MSSPATDAVFRLYGVAWSVAVPLLRFNSRLKDGYHARTGRPPLPRADIWIQAASGGEAYMALELVRELTDPPSGSMLVTTNTRQGMDVLTKAIEALPSPPAAEAVRTAFFPFDQPQIMEKAIKTCRPGVIVLLESEMWPGLMRAAQNMQCPTIIVNGRMTQSSFRRYRLFPSLWRKYRPARILAISNEDARRFAELFGGEVTVMHNIKFDRLQMETADKVHSKRLDGIIPEQAAFVVLGSVRKDEESDILHILDYLRRKTPHAIVGLVPRHLHRLPNWRRRLAGQPAPWVERSAIKRPVSEGTIILWDTFGELDTVYSRSDAVFVGGSLAPLGGQNFLEPLMWGVPPVIGPHWDNFAWVGSGIFERRLAVIGARWQAVAAALADRLQQPMDKQQVRRSAAQYLSQRQGGTRLACRHIRSVLAHSRRHMD